MNDFIPFLGRIIVEAVEDDTQEYLKKTAGIAKDSPLANMVFAEGITDHHTGQFRALSKRGLVPLTKGKIVFKSATSFGEYFEKHYGKDNAEEGRKLKIGDIVSFIENQTYKLDPEGKYFLLNDEHIVGYTKVEVTNE